MNNYQLLNNIDHQDLRIITDRSAEYGDKMMFAPTFPAEFRDVQATYPILFHQNAEGNLYPVALFGFEDGENLFLDESGWQAPYIPAMVRRQPFMIGFQRPADGSQAEPTRVLSLDMDHPRVSRESGEALFQPLGGRTPFLESAANLLEFTYAGLEHSGDFVRALAEHELFEQVSFNITLKDGSTNQLLGFHTINEERLQELSGKALKSLSDKGFLMPVFLSLASLSHIQTLVSKRNDLLDE
jgi:hypothetical protein